METEVVMFHIFFFVFLFFFKETRKAEVEVACYVVFVRSGINIQSLGDTRHATWKYVSRHSSMSLLRTCT